MLPTLDADTRLLIAPYSGPFGAGGDYADAHDARVGKPLDDWATSHERQLILVEGLQVTVYGARGAGVGPTTIPELRQVTALSRRVVVGDLRGQVLRRDRSGRRG
ncbi:hypothetical protein CLV71_120149 [Actinophytocola oryzae]|uniref:Uncharacterized protein n=1 Tax=Actinophytocola oryzae TaxID=502181 RepID=A0A4R7UXC0_9PSEU|nr:hypothetical protein CLV71_120149 [Actinophytocola oryzae]